MRRKDVKTVIAYYFGIPAMRGILADEWAELEDEYNGLRGTFYDGMPHSSTPGKPVEELAERADAGNVWGKLETIAVRVHVLETDREKIQDCLNAINGEYTRLILYRYRDKYSWVKIAAKMGITERTAKRWGERALDRLGEALEEVTMPDEILGRASRARV
ncbi:MAG: hypothetical protein K2L38_03645 [Dysosmobacter sp.]|nr:hypothetical protein [Dysosmobacter sp.]